MFSKTMKGDFKVNMVQENRIKNKSKRITFAYCNLRVGTTYYLVVKGLDAKSSVTSTGYQRQV